MLSLVTFARCDPQRSATLALNRVQEVARVCKEVCELRPRIARLPTLNM